MSRGSLLTLSIIVSLVLHGVLIAVSPRISLLSPITQKDEVLRTFRVKLLDAKSVEARREEVKEKSRSLTTRPGSVEELLARESEMLQPASEENEPLAAVPSLDQRLAAEDRLEREHHFEADSAMLQAVDTKIIEIDRSAMREDIQIARRIVQPSTERILDADILPTLRGDMELDEREILAFTPAGGAGGEGILGGQGDTSTLPLPEPEVVAPAKPSDAIPLQPVEREVATSNAEEALKQDAPKFQFMDDMLDMILDTYVPPGEEKGYFRLRIVPKKGEDIPVLPKDVTLVIDASRSIQQRRLDGSVQGVNAIINALRPEDRFNIVVFRENPSFFQEGLVLASPEVKAAAQSFLTGMESKGETDVYQGVRPVVQAPPREDAAGGSAGDFGWTAYRRRA